MSRPGLVAAAVTLAVASVFGWTGSIERVDATHWIWVKYTCGISCRAERETIREYATCGNEELRVQPSQWARLIED